MRSVLGSFSLNTGHARVKAGAFRKDRRSVSHAVMKNQKDAGIVERLLG